MKSTLAPQSSARAPRAQGETGRALSHGSLPQTVIGRLSRARGRFGDPLARDRNNREKGKKGGVDGRGKGGGERGFKGCWMGGKQASTIGKYNCASCKTHVAVVGGWMMVVVVWKGGAQRANGSGVMPQGCGVIPAGVVGVGRLVTTAGWLGFIFSAVV